MNRGDYSILLRIVSKGKRYLAFSFTGSLSTMYTFPRYFEMSATRFVLSNVRLFKLSQSKHNLALMLAAVEQNYSELD